MNGRVRIGCHGSGIDVSERDQVEDQHQTLIEQTMAQRAAKNTTNTDK